MRALVGEDEAKLVSIQAPDDVCWAIVLDDDPSLFWAWYVKAQVHQPSWPKLDPEHAVVVVQPDHPLAEWTEQFGDARDIEAAKQAMRAVMKALPSKQVKAACEAAKQLALVVDKCQNVRDETMSPERWHALRDFGRALVRLQLAYEQIKKPDSQLPKVDEKDLPENQIPF